MTSLSETLLVIRAQLIADAIREALRKESDVGSYASNAANCFDKQVEVESA